MSVKVIKNKVFDGTKTYEVGDVIEGLSEKDESQLITEGIVEHVYVIEAFNLPEGPNSIDSKVDEPLAENSDKEEATIDEDQEQNIDPNNFALNTEEYVNIPDVKSKKKK